MLANMKQRLDNTFTLHSVPAQNATSDYVFETAQILPQGAWTITIERGDAWIFTGGSDFILHTGQSAFISESDGPVLIRRLYERGFALYNAAKRS